VLAKPDVGVSINFKALALQRDTTSFNDEVGNMNALQQTVCDTVFVIAAVIILALLFPFVIARAEPDWQGFASTCVAVVLVSPLLSRMLCWACGRLGAR
jgi:ABC-type spermidine/putrescine transport system permease subunit I